MTSQLNYVQKTLGIASGSPLGKPLGVPLTIPSIFYEGYYILK